MDPTGNRVEWRQATAADIEAMADAHRDSIRNLGAAHYPRAVADAWELSVQPGRYLAAMRRGEVFFLAVDSHPAKGTVLGFSSDYVIWDTMHGTCAYVRAGAARLGVGTRLLTLAERFGIGRGATEIRIQAALGAVGFYRRNGFVETGRGQVALPGGESMPCVFMRKRLCDQFGVTSVDRVPR